MGSGNANPLHGRGNFGSRAVPKSASPRYIYTHLRDWVFNMYHPDDFPLLNH
jgi:DNA gyrase/topoisomerase IV subunit A